MDQIHAMAISDGLINEIIKIMLSIPPLPERTGANDPNAENFSIRVSYLHMQVLLVN